MGSVLKMRQYSNQEFTSNEDEDNFFSQIRSKMLWQLTK